MRITVALVALLWFGPIPVVAQAWDKLEGQAIAAALSARVLEYADGTSQDFFTDGRTRYGESLGRWEVRGDHYCSLWPPSDRWTCYSVDTSGPDIRFTGDDGTVTIGRYVDLQ